MAPTQRIKLKPNQVATAGEHYVAAEIHGRGGYAVTFSGNMLSIDVLASDVDQRETVGIQVKTRRVVAGWPGAADLNEAKRVLIAHSADTGGPEATMRNERLNTETGLLDISGIFGQRFE
jgi:hypothetical protein